MCFFFFKQKTAYEMRISDWSSDVCSSDLEVRLLVELRRTADMEGTHGKLRARLTNGLRCDDAYGFTDVDRRTASKITTIAFAAHAHLRLADQRRADPDRLDADGLDPRDGSFVEQCACFNENGAILAVDNVFRRGTAKNALTERSNDRTALNDGLHLQRVFSAAILLDNCAILRHGHKDASTIGRASRRERRVGKALAGAVRRVEILEDGEAFLKVRDNWRFNEDRKSTRLNSSH